MTGLVLALVLSQAGNTPFRPPYRVAEINTDIPLALPGSPAAALASPSDADAPEMVIQLQAQKLFLPPQDGLYLNTPAAIHAANDRVQVNNGWTWPQILIAIGGVVVPAALSAYVADRAARKLPLVP